MRFVGIDASTMTGLVILDREGNLIDSMEITGKGKDPARMVSIISETIEQLEVNDIVCIENFGFNSNMGFILGGIGWGIRCEMYIRGINYLDVAPNSLKLFVSGHGQTKKDSLAVEIYKKWGFEHKSDNVRDAYALAQIARSRYLLPKGEIVLHKYQLKVLEGLK